MFCNKIMLLFPTHRYFEYFMYFAESRLWYDRIILCYVKSFSVIIQFDAKNTHALSITSLSVSKTGEYNSRVRGRGRGDYGSERGGGFDRGRGSDRGGRGGLDI